MTAEHAKAARELLAFYLEAGADAFVGEAPVNRLSSDIGDEASAQDVLALARPEQQTPAARANRPVAPADTGGSDRGQRSGEESQPLLRPPPGVRRIPASPFQAEASAIAAPPQPAAPEAAVMAAREAARSAASLDDLAAILAGFDGCALKATASRLVFADGDPRGRAMFVGEAPGAEEDREGLPFVGRSGRLLDRMMAAIGLDRRSAYIANIIPWRPPGNRTPTPLESQICLPFILRQIELADPDILVCLGAPAAQALIGVKEGIMKTRGRWFAYATGTREIRAMATLHPAYLLRQPLAKRLAWRDFLAIKAALDAPRGLS